MDLGVVFPQLSIGIDPDVIREYARRAERAGYGHVLAYDHVVGGDIDGPYDYEDTFHEPLTLFAHLAAVTDDLTFVTGVLILPQRQTVLVAKQAAELDLLSDGRLRLGVGIGWNELEYETLGMDFSTRGRRIESQVGLLRSLWTRELVDHEDEWHAVSAAGINPLPVQRPIPIWIGGTAEPALRRAGRIADGWLPQTEPGGPVEERLETVRAAARDAGRDPDDLSIAGRMAIEDPDADPETWADRVGAWRDLGATHLAVNTMPADLESPIEHAELVESVMDAVADEV